MKAGCPHPAFWWCAQREVRGEGTPPPWVSIRFIRVIRVVRGQNRSALSAVRPLVLKRKALRHRKNQRGKPITAVAQRVANPRHRWPVLVLQPPAKRVSEHLLRHAAAEIIRPFARQQLA